MKATLLTCLLFVTTHFVFAQVEPANNDQKLRDSSVQTTPPLHSKSASTSYPIFSVKGDSIVAFTQAQKDTMSSAYALFARVMNDTGFQHALLSKKFLFDQTNDPMRQLTTQHIVDTLYSGVEWYKKTIDHFANIYWVLDQKRKPLFQKNPAIGYGNENGKVIYTYTWWFGYASLSDIAGHIAHEWSHKVGFNHRLRNHNGRDETVPYAFGYLVRDYAKN